MRRLRVLRPSGAQSSGSATPPPGTAAPRVDVLVTRDGQIQVVATGRPSLRQWVTAAEQVLQLVHDTAGPPELRVYRYGDGLLAHLVETAEAIRLKPLHSGPAALGVLIRAATWYAADETVDPETGVVSRQLQLTDPPRKVAADLLAWPSIKLPPLRGLSRIPHLAPDGSLVGLRPGYEARTQYLYAPGALPTAAERGGRPPRARGLAGGFPAGAGRSGQPRGRRPRADSGAVARRPGAAHRARVGL